MATLQEVSDVLSRIEGILAKDDKKITISDTLLRIEKVLEGKFQPQNQPAGILKRIEKQNARKDKVAKAKKPVQEPPSKTIEKIERQFASLGGLFSNLIKILRGDIKAIASLPKTFTNVLEHALPLLAKATSKAPRVAGGVMEGVKDILAGSAASKALGAGLTFPKGGRQWWAMKQMMIGYGGTHAAKALSQTTDDKRFSNLFKGLSETGMSKEVASNAQDSAGVKSTWDTLRDLGKAGGAVTGAFGKLPSMLAGFGAELGEVGAGLVALLGPVGVAIGAGVLLTTVIIGVAAAIAYLPFAVRDFATSVLESQRHFAEVSGQMAQVMAKFDVFQILYNQKVGESIAPSAAGLENSIEKLMKELMPYVKSSYYIINTALSYIVDGMTLLTKILESIAVETIRLLEGLWVFNKGAADGLKGILDHMRKDSDSKTTEGARFLNEQAKAWHDRRAAGTLKPVFLGP